LNDMSQQMKDK